MEKIVTRARLLAVVLVVLATALVVVPQVSAADEVHLAAAGDFGARANTNAVLNKIADIDPDATLALGDLAYGDVPSEQAWCDYVKARVGEDAAFQLVSGNHESLDVQDGAINNFSACLPNQVPGIVGTYGRQYYMDFPKGAPLVRVIEASKELTFEDGKWVYAQGDARYNWVSSAIDDARAKGAKWIVVSNHLPCLSVGGYACPANRDFYNLMISKKVDLVLHGHEHSYQRTHQLRAGVAGCTTLTVGSFNPACVADTDGNFTAGQGTVFATVGTGGIPLRDVNSADTEAGYFASYTGLNRDPSYGVLDMHATDTSFNANFLAAVGTGTDGFTLTKGEPPANQTPTAAFTSSTSGLAATVDGAASSDPDGSVASYEWEFGDGATATGVRPSAHTYSAAGTYNVTLKVTDNLGATNSITKAVTVEAAPSVVKIAEDTFTRTAASGWGTAQLGGAWTTYPTSAFSVANGEGRLSSPVGSGRNMYLRAVASSSTDVLATLAVDRLATGGGLYASLVGRAVPNAGEYTARIKYRSDGKPGLALVRNAANGSGTIIANEVLPAGLTYAPGEELQIRLQVVGTGSTTIRAKLWKVGQPEPTAWAVSATDTTAGLQANGAIGFVTYLSSSATNGPILLTIDDILATRP